MGVLERLRNRRERSAEPESTDELLSRIDQLTDANRDAPDGDREREILSLRHRAALQLIDEATERPGRPEAAGAVTVGESGVPEVSASELSAPVLRSAILSHGCLLVRGLLDQGEVQEIREKIDRAFESREQGSASDYFSEFVADPRFDLSVRAWMGGRANFLGPDSPRAMVDLLDLYQRSGLREVAEEYLGERPAISFNKCTFRRVYPDDFEDNDKSFWHQDGAFLGDVSALNTWLALTRCGDVAPGLDIVPKRLEEIVPTGTEGATFDWSVSQSVTEETAGERGIVRPIFHPGDVLLFDDLLLHGTGAEASMPETRYAVECWFFGPSAYPAQYAPIAT